MAKGKYWKTPIVYVRTKKGKSKKAIKSTEILAISKDKQEWVILKDRRRLRAHPKLKKMQKEDAEKIKYALRKFY